MSNINVIFFYYAVIHTPIENFYDNPRKMLNEITAD